jgi:acyl-CoA synthetase (AMP-forming)/AMP-acid ligase II
MTHDSICSSVLQGQLSTLVDLLRFRACNQADQQAYTFLVDGESQEAHVSYGVLDHQARALAATLQALNLPGDCVLLLYPPGLDYITAFYGCLYAGVIPVPTYSPVLRREHRSMQRLWDIIDDAQVRFVLTTQDLFHKMEVCYGDDSRFARLQWITTDNRVLADAEDWAASTPDADALAYLQYTSGSTGTPKGVMLTHRNVMYNSALIHQAFAITPESRGVIWLPPYHDMGLLGGIIVPLYAGIHVVLLSPFAFLQRPLRWLRAISRYQGTYSGGPNFAYELCVQKSTPEQLESLDLQGWQVAFNGAEPVRSHTLQRFINVFEVCGFRREAFYPCYGLAESTLFVTGGMRGKGYIERSFKKKQLEHRRVAPVALEHAPHEGDALNLVGCGWSWGKQQIAIVAPEHRIRCSANQIGEIWLASPSVAQGYWKRPTETTETFQAYLADTGAGPFLRTGDLGFLWEDELFITGRLKDLIIIRGRNHGPQDIERTVEQSNIALQHDAGVAFSIEVDGEERLVVVQGVKSTAVRNLDVKSVIGDMCEALAAQHGLHVYDAVLVTAKGIPKTASGKVQRHLCRAQYLNGTLENIGKRRR